MYSNLSQAHEYMHELLSSNVNMHIPCYGLLGNAFCAFFRSAAVKVSRIFKEFNSEEWKEVDRRTMPLMPTLNYTEAALAIINSFQGVHTSKHIIGTVNHSCKPTEPMETESPARKEGKVTIDVF